MDDLGATRTGSLLLTLTVAVVVATGLGLVVVAVLRRLARRWNVTVLSGRLWQSPVVVIFALAAGHATVQAADPSWADPAIRVLQIGEISAIAWLLIVIVRTLEKAALANHPQTGPQDGRSRHVRTKITLLRRVAVASIATIAVGTILWTIPQVRAVGATVLASAGIVGIIAGLAAQTSLANIFAGVQIAFTDGIRVGDIVTTEGTTGRIQEITLTYIVVESNNGTSMILPCTYFTTTPFHNWSHTGAAVTGRVSLAVDWHVPLDDLRAELARILQVSDHWDGRHGNLVVDDAEDCLRVLALVSAADGETLQLLCWQVRERLVHYITQHHGSAVPRVRQERVPTNVSNPDSTEVFS